MIWAAFSCKGKATIAVCSRWMNSKNYQGIVEEYLLPFCLHFGNNILYFQEDNCTTHKSVLTRNWLLDNAIDVLHWLGCSSDLNPMENQFVIIFGSFWITPGAQNGNSRRVGGSNDRWHSGETGKLNDQMNWWNNFRT